MFVDPKQWGKNTLFDLGQMKITKKHVSSIHVVSPFNKEKMSSLSLVHFIDFLKTTHVFYSSSFLQISCLTKTTGQKSRVQVGFFTFIFDVLPCLLVFFLLEMLRSMSFYEIIICFMKISSLVNSYVYFKPVKFDITS